METLESEVESPLATLRYPDAKSFSEFVEALSRRLDEARFDVTKSGVKVAGLDSSKTAYIEVFIPKESFLDYDIGSSEESVYMGVRLESLAGALGRGRKGEPVLFKVSHDKIYIQIDSGVVRRHVLPNIEVYIDLPGNVELEHDVEASIMGEVLDKAVKDVEVVSKDVELEATGGKLIIRAKSEGRSRVETVLQEGSSSALLYLEVRKPSVSVYEVSFVKDVLNLTRIAESVELKFSSERPLELVFKTPDGGRVRYILAPSVG